jgi:hypothetical protein
MCTVRYPRDDAISDSAARKTRPNRTGRPVPLGAAVIGLLVAVGGTVGRVVAVGATVAVGAGVGVGEALGLALGEALGLGDGLALGDALGLGEGLASTGDEQDDPLIVLLSRVTAPVRASARPFTVAPEVIVIDVRAMIVPARVEPVASVAELVTCQKTLQGLAPLMSATRLDDDVMNVEVALKIQTEFGSPWPSSVSVPVRLDVAALTPYTPATRVNPASSVYVFVTGRPAAST